MLIDSSIKLKKLTASSAEFFPPFIPTVATGTPGGICTIDRSESIPSKDLLDTGTPITGSVVCAAVTPGRCAAPPAAAIITFSPLSIAVFEYFACWFGVL